MTDWEDNIPPEWLKKPIEEFAPDEPRRFDTARFLASLMAMAVAWLAAAAGYSGFIPVWVGGLVVVLAGAACWTVEWAS